MAGRQEEIMNSLKISLLSFLLLTGITAWSQENIILENGQDYDPARVLPFMDSLHTGSDLVITFRVKVTDKPNERSDYFILSRSGSDFKACRYNTGPDKLQEISLPPGSYDFLWKTFIQNELFTIKDEKDISNFCPKKYQIFDSYTYEFIILSGGRMKKLSYYDPEYYDNACYGLAERMKIINSVSAINYVLDERK